MAVTADQLEQWHTSHRQRERTIGMLRAYQRGGQATVAIEDVLDLLGQDPETAPRQPEARRAQARDPREDPLTGAMWAGPPGSSPPPAVPRG